MSIPAPERISLSPQQIRARVTDLLPAIGERAGEIETARRLPADLVRQLKDAGAFRMPMPRSWGGPEMTPRQQVEIIELLSRADPSVGWCVMIGCDSGYFSAFLDDAVGRELCLDLDVVTAGWATPAGRAVWDRDAYVVDGRWSFASGCTHADLIVAGCVEFSGDEMRMLPSGQPATRIVVAPADAWTINDTWFTTGLAGSGSNDYSVTGLRVPAEHTFTLQDRPRRPGPLYAFPGMFFAIMSGVPLGLARSAIDATLDIAQYKTIMPQRIPMRSVPRVRAAIAHAETAYGAARAYVYDVLDRLWAELEGDGVAGPATRAQLALSRANAFQVAREVAELMVDTVGTQAIYRASPLDRLLRDAITMKQHIAAQDRMLEIVGGMLLGEPSTLPFL